MRKMRFIFYLLVLFVWASCSKDEEEESPILEINQESFTFGNEGGEMPLEICSNGEWGLSVSVPWCSVLPKEGTGNAEVKIHVLPNVKGKQRKTTIVVREQKPEYPVTNGVISRKIEVTQEGISLEVDSTRLCFPLEGGEVKIGVQCNAEWVVEGMNSWCRAEKQADGFIVTVTPLSESLGRTVELAIRSGEVKRLLKVVQGRYHQEGEVRLYREEDAGNPVKLVFMGDGFIEEDMIGNGAYDQAMEEAIEAFLSTEPYPSYRNYFCPYIVYAYSGERGMSTRGGDDKIKVKKETAFSVDVKEGTTLMNADMNKVLEYARKVPGLVTTQASIIVVANDPRYAGTCYHWGNGQTVSLVPMNRDLRPPGGFAHLITHEGAGHGFGRLADEYSGNGKITAAAIERLKNDHFMGQFWNVTTSQDPVTVYWSDFIGRQGYEKVGFFEGGYTYGSGVWRCEERNCMVDNIFYFSVACRLAIVKRIKQIAGEVFSLEDFIARDVQKAPTPGQLAGTRSYSPDYYPAPTPPVFVK